MIWEQSLFLIQSLVYFAKSQLEKPSYLKSSLGWVAPSLSAARRSSSWDRWLIVYIVLTQKGLQLKRCASHVNDFGSCCVLRSYTTRSPTREERRDFPLLRMLWTNSKKPRYKGSFSCEMPRWGRNQLRRRDQNPSIVFTCTSQKPSPSSSRAYSPELWFTLLCPYPHCSSRP